MKATIVAGTALVFAFTGASAEANVKPGTYSISLAPMYCDHLTVTVDRTGAAYGASDTSGCDQGPMVGTVAKLSTKVQPSGTVIQVGGTFSGSPYGYNWDFNLRTLTGTLRSTDGTSLLLDLNAAITVQYTKSFRKPGYANNGRPSILSVLRRR